MSLSVFNALVYAASTVQATTSQDALRNAAVSQRPQEVLRRYRLGYEGTPGIDAQWPERLALLNVTARWPIGLRQDAARFFLRYPAAATYYNALVLEAFGPAPLFTPRAAMVQGGAGEDALAPALPQLGALLRAAYAQGNGRALWGDMQRGFRRAPICVRDVEHMAQTLRAYARGEPPVTPARVIVNPYMPIDSGVTTVYAQGAALTVLGPATTPAAMRQTLMHELAHPIVHGVFAPGAPPAVALTDSHCAFTLVRQDPGLQPGLLGVYGRWDSYFSEALVRAMAVRLVPDAPARSHVPLERRLIAALQLYETLGVPFAQFTTETLDGLRRDLCQRQSAIVTTIH